MFNTPRTGSSLTTSSLLTQPQGGFADPLAPTSGYSEVDPWSGSQSPVRSPSPRSGVSGEPEANVSPNPSRDAYLNDPPSLYISLFRGLEPSHLGEVSLPAVQRLLLTSKLPASTLERILDLTAHNKVALDRSTFFLALALVALAQNEGGEVSLEALDAALGTLPLPQLQRPGPTQPQSSVSSSFSPWDTAPRYAVPGAQTQTNGDEPLNGGNAEAEAERGFWRRLETVDVQIIPEKEGWFLQKYRVVSDKRPEPLNRRYSDFVWLLTTLTQRYPFRLLPALPPKRISPDASFLEQRRKGLRRFLNALVNHPVIRDDGALNVFMTEINFEAWRKRMKVSTEEESVSKRLNPAQEMVIPSDLEEKLDRLRTRLPGLIASYQKMVTLAERELHRLQVAAAESSRFALSLQTVAEDLPASCHRCVPTGQSCDLCTAVGRGLGDVGNGWSSLAAQRDRDTATIVAAVEALKTQRDMYGAFRDLFHRHSRLSRDSVDTLRKRIEGLQGKIEKTRQAQKPGYEAEVEKLVIAIDQDNTTIDNLLHRRVFIRACMWHELSVVFHTRQAAAATLGWRAWANGEHEAAGAETRVWERLIEDLERMPTD
ncbi:Sorting nexin MVP1 [Vanrija pseudolonga]|uniref:Sorting nexin MVP1 n=1 Tax=Vanrija pseudolonga TaxID=143232 RepID=A0AAF0YBN6_9TREE|nr:Sorting nexin MVP1 [Vanrija pseudolonga]